MPAELQAPMQSVHCRPCWPASLQCRRRTPAAAPCIRPFGARSLPQAGRRIVSQHRLRWASDGSASRSRRPTAVRQARSSTSSADDGDVVADAADSSGGVDLSLVGSIAVVIAFGILNRVLYKMALVPLGNYVFFLAQFQTFGYVLVYASTLYFRYRQGTVTDAMLDAPNKRLFLYIGAMEAVSQLLGFIGANKLPGVVLPLLQQSILLWQVGLAYVVLGKGQSSAQLAGAAAVLAGVCTAAWPSGSGSSAFSQVEPLYAAVFVGSMLFPALSSIIKEKMFTEAKEKLGGKQLDLFVVNTFGSAYQAGFVFLLLPVLTTLRGIELGDLPRYLSEGFACFRGISPDCGSECNGAPLLPLIYVACNLGFNISILALLRRVGNVVSSLVLSTLVPLTIFAFTWPWPYLEPAPALGPNFVVGTSILLGGLLTYNSEKWWPAVAARLEDKSK